MDNPTQMTPPESIQPGSYSIRPWVVYSLGVAFMVLLFVCYVKADVALVWMESIIRQLFMQ